MEDTDDPLLLVMDDPRRPEEDVDGPQLVYLRTQGIHALQRRRARAQREREIENVKKVLN